MMHDGPLMGEVSGAIPRGLVLWDYRSHRQSCSKHYRRAGRRMLTNLVRCTPRILSQVPSKARNTVMMMITTPIIACHNNFVFM